MVRAFYSFHCHRVYLLDSFHIEREGKSIHLPTRKTESLFAYLIAVTPEALGGVMAAAMLLHLLVSSMAGFWAPKIIVRMGHDPAFGAHVLLTFITDSMGFFIFLGLATVFLL